MRTTGFFAAHLDKKLGFSPADLDQMSIRQQREVVTRRAKQLHKIQRLTLKYRHKARESEQGAIEGGSILSEDPVEKRRHRGKSNPMYASQDSPQRAQEPWSGVPMQKGDVMTPVSGKYNESLYSRMKDGATDHSTNQNAVPSTQFGSARTPNSHVRRRTHD